MPDAPAVSIIIPHYNGVEMLKRCLAALEKTGDPPHEIVLVDNASTDGSVAMVQGNFPSVHLIKNDENKGFAGACNQGIRATFAPYVLLLNNDVEVTPGWLIPLFDQMEADPEIAACQPKLLSLSDRRSFDYSGAAGGLIDIYGYPYARGRIITTIENDSGQYDEPADIFWACGTACMLRRSALELVGLLDETFFAHMEEIDLQWRFHNAGYRVRAVPKSVLYHSNGGTLPAAAYRKKYLNHRNSIFMLLKNYSPRTLRTIFPRRILIELIALAYSVAVLDFKRAAAIIAAFGWLVANMGLIRAGHRDAQWARTLSDSEVQARMLKKSVALSYFLRRRKTVLSLARR